MSSIQPIHAASAIGAPQPAASTEPAGAKPGHPFAEVMRSVAIPAAAKPSVSNASGATASAHSFPSQSTAGFKTHMNGKDAPASKPWNQAANGNPAIVASNQDGRNADPSPDMAVSSGAADGLGSFVAEGQVSSAVSVARAADQSGHGARVLSGAAQPASSPSDTARKQTPPAKKANANAHVSPSPAIATATRIEIASVPAIAVNIPVVKPPTRVQAGLNDELKSTSGMKPIDAHTMAKDSSLLRRAAASGPAVRIPQAGGSGAATGSVPNDAGVSMDGALDFPHPETHGTQTIDPTRSAISNAVTAADALATSGANQNSAHIEGSSKSQPASVADGISAHALANGPSNSAVDANTSNAASVAGTGNPGDAGNDPLKSVGHGASTSIHGGDGSKRSSFNAEVPTVATTAKVLPRPHVDLADSGVGLQNISNAFSSAGHPGASGSFSSSTPVSTAARATTADAFTALDSAASVERGVLLYAAPHQVAVGVSDPSLGWVEVRAERVSGQIAAALTTTSAVSHAALISVLPTMATYLQEHQAGVQQLHVETSLMGGHAGTGSQEQAPSQNHAHTAADNLTVADAATNSWNAAPAGRAALAAAQRSNFIHEGHFSIRA